MYQFRIKKQEKGGYKFELGHIIMLIDDYTIKEDKHFLSHPDKTFAYFYVEDNIYGLSNQPMNFGTAEEFYDTISKQYGIVSNNDTPSNGNNIHLKKNNGAGLNNFKRSA